MKIPEEWRLPTPHEVCGALLVVAAGAIAVDLFPDHSVWTKLCALAAVVFGGGGIASASKFLPTHVRAVLAEHDEQVKTALEAQEPKVGGQ